MSITLSARPAETRRFFSLDSPDQLLAEIQAVQDEIARTAFGLFKERGSQAGNPLDDWFRAEAKLLKPVQVSIKENDDHLTVTADVPGFSIDQIKVHVEGQNLRICGKTKPVRRNGESKRNRLPNVRSVAQSRFQRR